MGTNYYANVNICECCDEAKETIHIGKSSAGWTFSFHSTDEIASYKEWLKVLSGSNTRIKNEYNEIVSLTKFKKMIETKRDAPNNHARDVGTDLDFRDEEGNSFSEGEFS